MGFWTIYFGLYGGGGTPPVHPNDGWIAESRNRVSIADSRDRISVSVSRDRVWISEHKVE